MPRGFTLLEVMIALAILAIVSSIALPSFNDFIERSRRDTQFSAVATALVSARSEAVKRNQPVSMCKSSNGNTCTTTGDWDQGWIIFPNLDNNTVRATDGTEPIIYAQNALDGVTLLATNGANDIFTYLSDGTVQATETFNLCIGSDASAGRRIDIAFTGRPSRVKGATVCPSP